jgi:hypothetical protein
MSENHGAPLLSSLDVVNLLTANGSLVVSSEEGPVMVTIKAGQIAYVHLLEERREGAE